MKDPDHSVAAAETAARVARSGIAELRLSIRARCAAECSQACTTARGCHRGEPMRIASISPSVRKRELAWFRFECAKRCVRIR